MSNNPDPICPCLSLYNFTCVCSPKEIEAFKAGREWERKHKSPDGRCPTCMFKGCLCEELAT